MKISILTGSPRQNGNTAELCKPFMEELQALGTEVHYQALSGKNISPCKGCYVCQQVAVQAGTAEEYGCPQQDDMQALVAEIISCDVLVLATPIYSWFCPTEMKAMIDRLYGMNKFYGSGTGSLWAGKGIALITTHGYDREYGAGPFETGIQRECAHSNLHYLGMFSLRDEDDLASFQTAEAISGAKSFAKEIFAQGEKIRLGKILSHWDLQPEKLESVYSSAWNVDDRYILKHRESIEEIEKSIRLAELLGKAGFPVANYLPTLAGEPFYITQAGYWCLMEKLPGSHIDAFTMDAAFHRSLGRIAAQLHIALKDLETAFPWNATDCAAEFYSYILPDIQTKEAPVNPEIIQYIEEGLKNLYPHLPRQLIHRDLHTGNMLFAGDKLTGLLDFDLSVKNARLFDLCYFGLSFFAWHEDQPEEWLPICHAVFAGYEEILPLQPQEKAAIPLLMLYIEVLFVAFWRKANHPTDASAMKMTNWLWANLKRLPGNNNFFTT